MTRADTAWNFISEQLFMPETNLVYDFITSRDHEHRFDHLPTAEEIARQVPNPCGWGTGMEDCMLNAGSVMEILVLRHRRHPREEYRKFAAKVLEGMALCAEVHGVPGFVVRGVSPRDGRSCYINSSRDQFTLFVYGLWRYWRSALPGEAERARAAGLLVKVAEYCERTVTAQNGWNLLRLDGRPGQVSKLWECGPHEVLRLPMFYAAVYEVTGNAHWRELCLRYATPGIDIMLNLDCNHPWWDVELMQMQLSLVLLYETEPDQKRKKKYRHGMELAAQLALRCFAEQKHKFLACAGTFATLNTPWRLCPLKFRNEPADGLLQSVLFEGYPYLMPQFPESFKLENSLFRALGNLGITLFLFSREEGESFEAMFRLPDYAAATNDRVINLLHAHELLMRKT